MAWWTCESGLIKLQISKADAASGSHQGQCDSDVLELSRKPVIKRQLGKIEPGVLARTLKKYGAWDETELADHEQNLQRVLWLACGDIVDGNC